MEYGERFAFSCRMFVALMSCAAMALSMINQAVVSMSMVCMVDNNHTDADNGADDSGGWRLTFAWRRDWEQSWILASFFWGNLCFYVLAGKLVDTVGVRASVCLSFLVQAAMSAATARMTQLGWVVLCVNRFVSGAAQTAVAPAMYRVAAAWAPKEQRASLLGIAMAGYQLGAIVAMLVTSAACDCAVGWPLAYYIFAAVGLLFTIMWWLLVANSPDKQRVLITEQERQFLSLHCGQRVARKQRPKTPWLSMAKSPAVWALLFANTTLRWKVVVVSVFAPTYFKGVFHMSIKENGVSSMILFATQACVKVASPFIAGVFLSRRLLTPTCSVKVWNTIATFGMSACLCGLVFVPAALPALAVALYGSATGFMALTSAGFVAGLVALAPAHSGALSGLVMFAGSVVMVAGPYAIGAITANDAIGEWHTVFMITAGLTFISGIIFLLFGTGETASWAQANTVPENKVADVVVEPMPVPQIRVIDITGEGDTKRQRKDTPVVKY